MPGTDLPPAAQGLTVDTWMHRWPTGAEKAELWDGSLVFYGDSDGRDVALAQRAYPGRLVEVGRDSALWVHPSGGPCGRLRELLAE